MPLPTDPTAAWPPEHLADMYGKYAEWAAWYSGDPGRLVEFYGSSAAAQAAARTGNARPFFRYWQRIAARPGNQKAQLHVPIAGDLAAVSGALLFGEEPMIRIREAYVPNAGAAEKFADDRLQQLIIEGGAYNRIIEGAETAAAMGGVFMYPAWDSAVGPVPVVNVVQSDSAVPTFQFGMLASVIFWEVIDEAGHEVKRRLELHERGRVEHAVYVGTRTQIGSRLPDEAVLALGYPAASYNLPFDELDVQYIPNMRPNRLFRGSDLGLSDYSGSEGMFDALDEVYASWMRDIRLAKSRIIVPREFLNDHGDMDIDHEVYQPMDMEPGAAEAGTRSMLAQQFDIRWQEHQATAVELVERIVSNSGYAPQTFGIRIEGRAESGTALRVRESKTILTLKRKANWWRPALSRLFYHLMLIDAEVFGGPGAVGLTVDAEMNDGIPTDIGELAQAATALAAAKAASVETRVRLVNPHKDRAWVEAEVKRIMEQERIGQAADPAADASGMEIEVDATTGEPSARTARGVALDDSRAERGLD